MRSFYTGGRAASLLRNCCVEVGAVRGGDDAGGHAREVVGAGLGVFAQIAGTLAGDVAEGAPESPEAPPARVESDLADGHLRVPQQRLGLLDAACEQVAVRRQAERFLELPREVRLGEMAHLGQPPYGPLLVRGGVHAILRTQQAA